MDQRKYESSLPFIGSVHGPPKSLPKKGGILLLKGDPRSPFKGKIPPFLGRDLGGLCTEEVMKKLGISEHCSAGNFEFQKNLHCILAFLANSVQVPYCTFFIF